MQEVRVIITYSNKLESIYVDGVELDDISAIQNKSIEDWFVPANDRSGWEGLIPEIQKIINDEKAELNFEFRGQQESKHIFEENVSKLGLSISTKGLPKEEIALREKKEAKKAENRKDYIKAFQCYINAADDGESAEAQYKVGEYLETYADGDKIILDIDKEEAYTKMIKYYEKAANNNFTEAQYKLFHLYLNGKKIEKNIDIAIRWLRKAADGGKKEAQFELAEIYVKDNKDGSYGLKKATEWYEKAASQGLLMAQCRLGDCYYLGEGITQDKKKATEWYREAAEQGCVEAQWRLGGL